MAAVDPGNLQVSFRSYLQDICTNINRVSQDDVCRLSQLPWDDHCSVIIEKYNDLVTCLIDRTKFGERADRFKDVIIYIKMHFVFENEYMKMLHYPKIDLHRDQHDKFIIQLESNLNELIVGTVSLEKMVGYIGCWLIGHILISDKELEEYLTSLPEAHFCLPE